MIKLNNINKVIYLDQDDIIRESKNKSLDDITIRDIKCYDILDNKWYLKIDIIILKIKNKYKVLKSRY